MKLVRLFCVCCILLVNIGCTKQEKNVQESLNDTVNTVSENDNSVVNTASNNNNRKIFPNIKIILKTEDTKGVTDITEFFREYLKDKSDKDTSVEYALRVGAIVFHQDYSPEGNLEHLGDLKMFPNLRSLEVWANLISVDTDGLPDTLEYLNLSNNKIVSFNAGTLPQGIGAIHLENNNLSSFSAEVFPERLVWLDLSHNNLSYIDVGSLPQNLQTLNLSFNNLSSFDIADIAALPEKIEYVGLYRNPILIKYTPTEIEEILKKKLKYNIISY